MALNYWDLQPESYNNAPDTTQRSIVAAARKKLAGITTTLDTIRIPVEREFTIITEAQALDGPHEWDRPSYVVTFRKEGTEWKAISIE